MKLTNGKVWEMYGIECLNIYKDSVKRRILPDLMASEISRIERYMCSKKIKIVLRSGLTEDRTAIGNE